MQVGISLAALEWDVLEMVTRFVAPRGVDDPRVLEAMREVPRHRFVPEPLRARAYGGE